MLLQLIINLAGICCRICQDFRCRLKLVLISRQWIICSRRLREIDVDGGANVHIVDPDAPIPLVDIVVKAVVEGTSMSATVSVPTTADLAHLPIEVVRQ